MVSNIISMDHSGRVICIVYVSKLTLLWHGLTYLGRRRIGYAFTYWRYLAGYRTDVYRQYGESRQRKNVLGI